MPRAIKALAINTYRNITINDRCCRRVSLCRARIYPCRKGRFLHRGTHVCVPYMPRRNNRVESVIAMTYKGTFAYPTKTREEGSYMYSRRDCRDAICRPVFAARRRVNGRSCPTLRGRKDFFLKQINSANPNCVPHCFPTPGSVLFFARPHSRDCTASSGRLRFWLRS